MTRKQMKSMVLGLLLTTACAGFITACGTDEPAPPQGRAEKGPVAGATVTDSSTPAQTSTTRADGTFNLFGTAPYTVTGGSYSKIVSTTNGVATTQVVTLNFPMKSVAGSTVITPLTTLAAAGVSFAGTGIDLTADLSGKSAANSAAFALSETIGAALSAAASTTPSSLATVQAAIVTALTPANLTTIANDGPGAPSTLATAIQTVLANITAGLSPANAALVNGAVATEATASANLSNGQTVPPPTGSTGSTGSTGTGAGQ